MPSDCILVVLGFHVSRSFMMNLLPVFPLKLQLSFTFFSKQQKSVWTTRLEMNFSHVLPTPSFWINGIRKCWIVARRVDPEKMFGIFIYFVFSNFQVLRLSIHGLNILNPDWDYKKVRSVYEFLVTSFYIYVICIVWFKNCFVECLAKCWAS
jgi:hypothetical protein